MNEMRCSDIDELLAGYAAGALDGDESTAVAVHLSECRNHDAELAAIRATFESLTVAVAAPVQPPAGLRSSLLDAFDRETAGSAPPSAAPQVIRPHERRDAIGRIAGGGWFAGAGFGYALAAALLVIAVGLGAWGLSREGGGDDVYLATTSEGGNRMQLTYIEDRHVAVLDVELEAPPEGHIYQAWQIVDGQPVAVGVLTTHSGQVAFAADLDDASAVALSVEPEPGSTSPTTSPVLVTDLPES